MPTTRTPPSLDSPREVVDPDEVETPVGIVDLEQARRNAVRVRGELASHGLHWRPHVKTHKSRTLASIQLETGAAGLTVATLHEAEAMASLGADLLLAHPPVGPAKEKRLGRFLETAALSVALDSREALATTARAGRAAGRTVPVLVEMDVGMARTGVQAPSAAVSLALDAADREGVSFGGVMFYPGHIRRSPDEQDEALAEVGRRLSAVLHALKENGLSAEVVSGGSTPTLPRSHEIPGQTEIRAGTCIFHDRDTVAMGIAEEREVAYRVLSTVISTAVAGQAVVDAGSKALSREEFRSGGSGYGVVHGRSEVIVRAVSEEHGILDLTDATWRPKVGDRVEIVPNHVCVSVNLQDRLLAMGPDGYRSVPLEGRGRGPWLDGLSAPPT